MTKTVFLHIGLPKTGTSLLQGVFMRSPDILAGFGIRYLQAGTGVFDDFGHHALVMAALGERGRRIDPGKPPELIAGTWKEARAEIDGCAEPRVMVSSELCAFDLAAHEDIARIVAWLTDDGRHEIRIVLTLRNVVDFVNSVYAQRVRDGHAGWVTDFIANLWPALNWTALAQRWSDVVGPGQMILLDYADLAAGPAPDTFLRLVFSTGHEGTLLDNPLTNPSLPDAAIRFIAAVNGSDMEQDAKWALRDHLVRVFASHASGLPRADVLSPAEKSLLQMHCTWPADIRRPAP